MFFQFHTLRNNVFTGMTDVRCTPRQTDRNLNQSISLSLNKVYFKFTRSQGRLQPAAHFVQGNSADPWATARDCPDANQEGEPIHRRTIRLDICILSICTPWKSANTYPPSPNCPHIPWPPTGVAPHDPRGSLCPCLPLLSPPDPVRPSYNTWPRPRDRTIGVQGKCPFLCVCLQAALPGPYPALVR